MDEYLYLPGDQDAHTGDLELPRGRAALLYIKGRREKQQDALWAGVNDGILIACAADGVSTSAKGGEMAKHTVEYARDSAKRQLNEAGTVDPRQMHLDVCERIQREHPQYGGLCTSLCMVIEGNVFRAHRIGDPQVRLNQHSYPDPNLAPENLRFKAFNQRLEAEDHKKQTIQALFRKAREAEVTGGAVIYNAIGLPSVTVGRRSATWILDKSDRLIAGSDGLRTHRDEHYEDELPDAKSPGKFMAYLREELSRCGKDNACGLTFFCES